VAPFWVKLPEISALPPAMPAEYSLPTEGAEMTTPSRTIPNWFCGEVWLARWAVTFWKSAPPWSLNCRFTT